MLRSARPHPHTQVMGEGPPYRPPPGEVCALVLTMIIVEEGGIPPSWPAHQLPAPQPPPPGIPPATALKPQGPENAIRNMPATCSGSGAMSGIRPEELSQKKHNPHGPAPRLRSKMVSRYPG